MWENNVDYLLGYPWENHLSARPQKLLVLGSTSCQMELQKKYFWIIAVCG